MVLVTDGSQYDIVHLFKQRECDVMHPCALLLLDNSFQSSVCVRIQCNVSDGL